MFVVDKVSLRNVFSEYFGFPFQFSYYQLLHTQLSIAVSAVGPIVTGVPSGLNSGVWNVAWFDDIEK
jgi:hypothetical protein